MSLLKDRCIAEIAKNLVQECLFVALKDILLVQLLFFEVSSSQKSRIFPFRIEVLFN